MLFLNSWIYTWASCCVLYIIQPFITVWVGEDFLFTNIVVIVLVLNFYIQGMRRTNMTFKEAAGIFYEDKFVPLMESFVNIVASILFAKMFGIVGVFMGTIVSSMCLFLYSYPVFVYKKVFGRKYHEFMFDHIKFLIEAILVVVVTGAAVLYIDKFINNNYLLIVINGIICMIIPNTMQLIMYRRREELDYYKNIVQKITSKFLKKTA